MKPCRKYKKAIAWSILNELDPGQDANLQSHLQNCEACLEYRRQVLLVTTNLKSLDQSHNIEPSASLHRRLLADLRKSDVPSAGLYRFVSNWRTALAAAGAVAVVVLVLLAIRPDHGGQLPVAVQPEVSRTPLKHEFIPTLANYRSLASQSLDEFDEVLTRQAKKPVASPPRLTAATLALIPID